MSLPGNAMPGNSLPRIVVLGAGLGGTIAAYEIRDATKGRAEVTVVSDSEDYWFVPSNPWVAVRWREPEAIRVPLAPVMAKKGIGFTSGGALRVHPQDQRIDLRDGTSITYDWLVIATGPELAFDEIPGFGPQGYTVSVCRTDHAAHAADAFDAFCADPKPIVVGAAQGASCFGPAYEFALILDTELRRRKIRDRVPMTFVTSEPYIGHLGLDGVGDTKGLLESEMRERHIKWITNARVASIEPGMMHVEEVGEDGAVKKAHDLPFGYSMLLPAFRGVEAVHGIEGLTNPRGFILADRHQRNPTFKNIYSLGVCVAIPPIGPTPVPVGVPKTGFMIESMVTAVAHNIASELMGANRTRCQAGTRSVWPISATAAWPLSPSPRSRRAMSTGPRMANGSIWPRSALRSTFSTKSAPAPASRFMKSSRSTCWGSAN